MHKLLLAASVTALSLAPHVVAQPAAGGLDEGVRKQLITYLEVFNKHDAKQVAGYWTADAVSVQEETGERTEGRAALAAEFDQFFSDYPQARLAGVVDHVRMVGAEVAIAEGTITLATGGGDPTRSAFTAVLQKQGGQWLIASSHERDLPSPETAYEALQGFEWLVGTWQDKTNDANVVSTVRWSPSKAFLIRSFEATFEDGEGISGTQIFGWDPLAKQLRTWTFNSDGSFGDGTVSKDGDGLMVKINQIQADGRLASGTSVLTRVDDDTIEVQKIGESVDGEPVPASGPVTVVRISDAESVSASGVPAAEGAVR